MNKTRRPILYALVAALCYGCSTPLSKLLLDALSPSLMAALLYLGAGFGMALVGAADAARTKAKGLSAGTEARVTRRELPYVFAMVGLDIAAPIFLMLGLERASSAAVSLMNNFEIVVTALIAHLFFREAIGKRLALAIALITLASALLSLDDAASLAFSPGVLLSLLACVCWGAENNCTRVLSLKDPRQIVVIKGLGAGGGALAIAAFTGSVRADFVSVLLALLLGFFAYGMSLYFYILAQRELGAARTSSYYAAAPFIGMGLSFALFRQSVTLTFLAALTAMALGAYFAAFEKHGHAHAHEPLVHEHRHSHDDGHHAHIHDEPVVGEHSHMHTHEAQTHAHAHTPDAHHASACCANGARTKASSGKRYACSHESATLYAGFPHLYFPANPAFSANFVKKAAQYARV